MTADQNAHGPLLDALSKVLGGLYEEGPPLQVFAQMDIAEEVIREQVALHPDRKLAIFASFRAMRSPLLRHVSPLLFRYHCEQIVQQVLADDGLFPLPTWAEIVKAVLSACMYSAPIRSEFLPWVAMHAPEMVDHLTGEPGLAKTFARYTGAEDQMAKDVSTAMREILATRRAEYFESCKRHQNTPL